MCEDSSSAYGAPQNDRCYESSKYSSTCRSEKAVRRRTFLNRHYVVAGVHGDNRAGDPTGEAATEEKGGLGDFIHRDIPL